MRLIELGLRHHIVAAAGACGVDLEFSRAHLGSRDVQDLLGVVERRARGISVLRKVRRPVEGLPGVQKVCLRLRQRFARRGQRQFIELPHPRLGLGDCPLRLHDGRSLLAGFKRNQGLALADPLALLHQHVIDRAGDLASDLGPERRLDMTAGNDGLHQIAAPGLIDNDRRPQNHPRTLPAADTERQQYGEDKPSVGPERKECARSRDCTHEHRIDRLFSHFNFVAARQLLGALACTCFPLLWSCFGVGPILA